MRPIAAWLRYMPSTIQVAPRTANDGYGKPTYGDAVSYRTHLTHGDRLVKGMNGQDIVCNVTAHLATPVVIPATSQVTLSTGDVGSTESYMVHPLIAAVGQSYDQTGLHHVVLFLNWAPRSI